MKVVSTEVIYDALYKNYQTSLDKPDPNGAVSYPLDDKVAHQFAYIHHQVKAEVQAEVEGTKVEESDTKNSSD
jgi:hypothetical protein